MVDAVSVVTVVLWTSRRKNVPKYDLEEFWARIQRRKVSRVQDVLEITKELYHHSYQSR